MFSAIERCGARLSSCWTTAMPSRRACAGVSAGASAARRPGSPPSSGRSTPESRLISVDLPAPFSPSSAWTRPGGISIETSRSTGLPKKRLLTASARRGLGGHAVTPLTSLTSRRRSARRTARGCRASRCSRRPGSPWRGRGTGRGCSLSMIGSGTLTKAGMSLPAAPGPRRRRPKPPSQFGCIVAQALSPFSFQSSRNCAVVLAGDRHHVAALACPWRGPHPPRARRRATGRRRSRGYWNSRLVIASWAGAAL